MTSWRAIRKLIHLTGIKPQGYTVVLSDFDGCSDLWVPSYQVGTTVVRAMRKHAYDRWIAGYGQGQPDLALTDLFDRDKVRAVWGLDPL